MTKLNYGTTPQIVWRHFRPDLQHTRFVLVNPLFSKFLQILGLKCAHIVPTKSTPNARMAFVGTKEDVL